MTEIQRFDPQLLAPAVEQALIRGDLSALSPEQRVDYYRAVCKSLGLNPLTKPFEYLNLSGRLILYATRAATDQLRALHGVSIEIVREEEKDGIYVVTARARTADGRVDEDTGAVSLTDSRGQRLAGDALANARMKATTKAKRRVTLSVCGLGWLDETEIETIPNAQTAPIVDLDELREQLTRLVFANKDKLNEEVLSRARQAYRSHSTEELKAAIEQIKKYEEVEQ